MTSPAGGLTEPGEGRGISALDTGACRIALIWLATSPGDSAFFRRKGPSMRRAYLMLPTVALVLTACGPKVTASHHAVQSPAAAAATSRPAPAATAASSSPSPSPSPTALIADTAMDVSTCRQFAAEQAGQMSPDQFNVWLLQNGGQTTIGPESSTGMDNTLSTNLGDWYVVQAAAPSGDLQPATYYAAEVSAECSSIGA
jgi:hypothetical protein